MFEQFSSEKHCETRVFIDFLALRRDRRPIHCQSHKNPANRPAATARQPLWRRTFGRQRLARSLPDEERTGAATRQTKKDGVSEKENIFSFRKNHSPQVASTIRPGVKRKNAEGKEGSPWDTHFSVDARPADARRGAFIVSRGAADSFGEGGAEHSSEESAPAADIQRKGAWCRVRCCTGMVEIGRRCDSGSDTMRVRGRQGEAYVPVVWRRVSVRRLGGRRGRMANSDRGWVVRRPVHAALHGAPWNCPYASSAVVADTRDSRCWPDAPRRSVVFLFPR